MSAPFDGITAVLHDYFDGLYFSDTQRLRKVFHPSAIYACATEGPLLELTMAEYFAVVDKRPAPASRGDARHDRIVSIQFAGSATAMARVECAIESKYFIDLLTFICLEGRWQIIAKVFHYDIKPP